MIVTSTQDKVKNEVETKDGTAKNILELFPERLHKVLEDLISESINTHGFEYTKFNAMYTISKNPKQYKAYFNKEADGEEMGKLATTVIMSLIADWMVKNVEVTVGNVKV